MLVDIGSGVAFLIQHLIELYWLLQSHAIEQLMANIIDIVDPAQDSKVFSELFLFRYVLHLILRYLAIFLLLVLNGKVINLSSEDVSIYIMIKKSVTTEVLGHSLTYLLAVSTLPSTLATFKSSVIPVTS